MSAGIIEVVQMGGAIMWFLFAGSVVAVGVFVERLLYYHRNTIRTEEFFRGIAQLLKKKRYDEALERCDESYGPSVRVIQAAILKRELPKDELKEILEEVSQLQVPKLEANLPILGTIATVAPLLGLLGTVTGLIQVFMEMSSSTGTAPINDLAVGVWEALVTTAGGLGLAIPCTVAFNFLHAKLNGIITDMERVGIEVLHVFHGGLEVGKASSKNDEGSFEEKGGRESSGKGDREGGKDQEKKGSSVGSEG